MFLLVKLNVRETRRVNKEWTKSIHNIAQYSVIVAIIFQYISFVTD